MLPQGRSGECRVDVPHRRSFVKHFFLILVACAAGLVAWWLMEVKEIPGGKRVEGFLAVWIGFNIELIGLLLIERSETRSKIKALENFQTQAARKFDHVSSLEQSISVLEQSV